MTIGEKLRELRISHPLTPKEWAGKLGYTVSHVYNLEHNRVNPSYDYLVCCALYLNITLSDLFKGVGSAD